MRAVPKTLDGVALRRLWLTRLGTGENGRAEYIGVSEEAEDEMGFEEREEHLSTEVLLLREHQA